MANSSSTTPNSAKCRMSSRLLDQAEPPGSDDDARQQIAQNGAEAQPFGDRYRDDSGEQIDEGVEQQAVIVHDDSYREPAGRYCSSMRRYSRACDSMTSAGRLWPPCSDSGRQKVHPAESRRLLDGPDQILERVVMDAVGAVFLDRRTGACDQQKILAPQLRPTRSIGETAQQHRVLKVFEDRRCGIPVNGMLENDQVGTRSASCSAAVSM